jgi:streptogramin lyase
MKVDLAAILRRVLVICLVAGWTDVAAKGDDLLVCGWFNHSVVRYDACNGALIQTLVSGGAGGLLQPHALHVGPDGNLYVASFGNSRVLRYDLNTGAFLPGPSGAAGTAQFVPTGSGGLAAASDLLFGPDGHLYVASFSNSAIMRYDGATGAPLRGPLGAVGTAQFVTPGSGGLTGAEAFVFGPDGSLYVASGSNSRILRYNGATGAFIDTFVPGGSGGLNNPHSLLFGPDQHLYVPAFGNNQVLRYDGMTGAPFPGPLGALGTAQFVAPGSGGLVNAHASRFAPDGRLYVTSFGNDRVNAYDGVTGAFSQVFVSASPALDGPIYPIFVPGQGIPADIDGNCLVDLADADALVAVLIDSPFSADHVLRADVNLDNEIDALDIRAFLDLVIP